MKPTRYTPDHFDAMGEGSLLLIGAGIWLGLLFAFIGKLVAKVCRAIGRQASTLGGFALGFVVGLVIGIPLWWFEGSWLGVIAR